MTLSALHGRHGGLEGLIAIVRDITAQREIEEQMHQSEKLTALGQLAGGIAHDFNNLLQAILGYAQLMKQNPANVEFVERSLDVVEKAAIGRRGDGAAHPAVRAPAPGRAVRGAWTSTRSSTTRSRSPARAGRRRSPATAGRSSSRLDLGTVADGQWAARRR